MRQQYLLFTPHVLQPCPQQLLLKAN